MLQARVERTKEEATELKAWRRAEIERRALLLDPPLPAAVLAHIPSFQAAIQIIAPLDDSAWELLKPRLLAQRADAEQHEREVAMQKEEPEERKAKRKRDEIDEVECGKEEKQIRGREIRMTQGIS